MTIFLETKRMSRFRVTEVASIPSYPKTPSPATKKPLSKVSRPSNLTSGSQLMTSLSSYMVASVGNSHLMNSLVLPDQALNAPLTPLLRRSVLARLNTEFLLLMRFSSLLAIECLLTSRSNVLIVPRLRNFTIGDVLQPYYLTWLKSTTTTKTVMFLASMTTSSLSSFPCLKSTITPLELCWSVPGMTQSQTWSILRLWSTWASM